MHFDNNTPRKTLEDAAFIELNLSIETIAAKTDAELLELIEQWIEDGDECGAV